jgi:phosphoglycerate kinase
MNTIKSPLHTAHLEGMRVLLRADLNVPLSNGSILSDIRLQAIEPTIKLIQKKGGKIILITHIGRPKDQEATLSTKTLLPWFTQRGYSCVFENDLNQAYAKSFHDPKIIVLLENLRFYPGEKQNDPIFAQNLARLADVYVGDAFGNLHRTDCSMIEVPRLFSPQKRMFGLLIEKEINHANQLLNNPVHPFVCIIGGNKIKDKLPLITHLLNKIDTLILCPAIVFTYLKSLQKPVGSSLVDQESFDACKILKQNAQAKNVSIMVPSDYLVSSNGFAGPYSIKKADQLTTGDFGISIGPETQQHFSKIIKESKTSFYNGLMGDLAYPQSLEGIKTIFQAMFESKGYSAIGGGDSTGAAEKLGFAGKISYLSTGGGALIAYLSEEKMPALDILINK